MFIYMVNIDGCFGVHINIRRRVEYHMVCRTQKNQNNEKYY